MALNYHIICSVCGKAKDVMGSTNSYPDICNSCEKTRKDTERKNQLDELAKLSVEDRIRKIEEWIHDYRPNRNNNFIMG
jgi:hypothetical protein